MIKIKDIFKKEKNILINIFSLFSINFLRFFINILTLPHLIKNYGPTSWGEITILQIFINYFIWITDWSLDQHSSKMIAVNEGKINKQKEVFSSSISAQFILLIISLLIINTYSFYFANYKQAFIYSNLIIIGNFAQSHWYLYGREKLYESAIIQLINKIIFAILILLLINQESLLEDYFLYMGASSLFVGILFIINLKVRYKINFFIYDFKSGIKLIMTTFRLFISDIWSTFSNSLISIIISSSMGNYDLGIFNIADRIKSLAIQSIHPIIYSLFPKMSRKYDFNKKEANKLLKKIILLISILIIFAYLLINLYINDIVLYFSNTNFQEIINVLRILLIAFVLSTLNEQLITYYFIPNNMYKFINRNRSIKFFISILPLYPLLLKFGIVGAAISYVLSELIGLLIIINKFNSTRNVYYKKK